MKTGQDIGAGRALLRGLTLRCPECGSNGLFEGWLKPRQACPSCGLRLDRGEGDHFLGAYTVNFSVAEIALVVFLGLVALVTWPDVPWGFVLYGGLALMVLAPIAFFPVSRTLWLAIDLLFRKPTPSDFVEGSASPEN